MPFAARCLPSRWFARPPILAVTLLLTLLAVSGFLALRYLHERQAAGLAVEHSRQVLDTLDQLRANVANLEADRRGYLLTLDPTYLKPYGAFDESVRRQGAVLQNLVTDDPLQSLRAAHLMLTLSGTSREMDDIVKAARTSGLDATLAINRSMDEIRSQIDQMVDHQRFLLVSWETRAEALEQSKTWLIGDAAIAVTIVAGAALALARLEARRRRKATEENVHLQSDLEEREQKIRSLVDANIIGIIIWDLGGRILEANDAFLRMVGYDREDLAAGRVHWTSLTPPEWRERDARTMAELELTGTVQPFEKQYSRRDGSRVPVLIGGTMFEEGRNQGVAFVLDLSERKRAEAEARESERRYRDIQMELAHANRVATMGQLTASIAHEVNQPIAAAVTNAQAALRWLGARPPDLEEVRQALARIVRDANRAGDVIGRIRGLVKKAPAWTNSVDMNEAVRDVIELVSGEAVKNGVSLQTELGKGLPLIKGDRVQLQQVVLNLIINAVQAVSTVADGAREVLISTAEAEPSGVLVAVKDSGPGLAAASLDRLFDAFYTTRPGGLGMGLSICRSILEAHEGRLWVSANRPRGAVFQFTLPLERAETVPSERAGPMPAV